MSGLVSGYSGIIAPPNLLANGNFAINQRAFPASFTPPSVGTYVADMWYYQTSSNVDYLEALVSAAGYLMVKGYGKKGQVFNFEHRDTSPMSLSLFTTPSGKTPFTSGYTVYASTTSTPCAPVQCSLRTWQNPNSPTTYYTKSQIIQANKTETAKQVVQCMDTRLEAAFSTRHQLQFTLLEDGEFQFRIMDAFVIPGLYKNPPKHFPTAYADDLARCQRYYQKGSFKNTSSALKDDTNKARMNLWVQFQTIMASVPTVTVNPTYLNIYSGTGGSTATGVGFGTFGASGNTTDGFQSTLLIDDATNGPAAYNNGVDSQITWTAEVV